MISCPNKPNYPPIKPIVKKLKSLKKKNGKKIKIKAVQNQKITNSKNKLCRPRKNPSKIG